MDSATLAGQILVGSWHKREQETGFTAEFNKVDDASGLPQN